MRLLVLLTPLIVLGAVLVLQRMEGWMDRTSLPPSDWRAMPVPQRMTPGTSRATRVGGPRG